ncbi:hypothetical protein [Endozoicomonas sp. ALB060]|uniref:hypothetical protein n=1 Tax=Endozoicomonas sp. ALB060 TaxID=3403072 RepID=UPI003BB51238
MISTSNGLESSINSREGGNCLRHNMRIRIHVCKSFADPDPNCGGPYDPKSNICPATNPVADPVADPGRVTTLAPLTTPVPTTISETYDDTVADTTTVTQATTAGAAESTSAGYHHPPARSIELVWLIGYNQTQTEHISDAANHPLVALCEAPNSKVRLLNDKGTIVDSWLCQYAGERLVILKPEYQNGDVYQFEALAEYGSVRPWKSTLTVNVGNAGNFRQRLISEANSLYHLPGFAFLVSMYLIAARAF